MRRASVSAWVHAVEVPDVHAPAAAYLHAIPMRPRESAKLLSCDEASLVSVEWSERKLAQPPLYKMAKQKKARENYENGGLNELMKELWEAAVALRGTDLTP